MSLVKVRITSGKFRCQPRGLYFWYIHIGLAQVVLLEGKGAGTCINLYDKKMLIFDSFWLHNWQFHMHQRWFLPQGRSVFTRFREIYVSSRAPLSQLVNGHCNCHGKQLLEHSSPVMTDLPYKWSTQESK
jgi:hypothetical protein